MECGGYPLSDLGSNWVVPLRPGDDPGLGRERDAPWSIVRRGAPASAARLMPAIYERCQSRGLSGGVVGDAKRGAGGTPHGDAGYCGAAGQASEHGAWAT